MKLKSHELRRLLQPYADKCEKIQKALVFGRFQLLKLVTFWFFWFIFDPSTYDAALKRRCVAVLGCQWSCYHAHKIVLVGVFHSQRLRASRLSRCEFSQLQEPCRHGSLGNHLENASQTKITHRLQWMPPEGGIVFSKPNEFCWVLKLCFAKSERL